MINGNIKLNSPAFTCSTPPWNVVARCDGVKTVVGWALPLVVPVLPSAARLWLCSWFSEPDPACPDPA